jgi:hypothetical protein
VLTAPGAPPDEATAVEPDVALSPARSLRSSYLAERGGWSLVWLAVVTGGVDVWGFWWRSPAVAALAPLMIVGGLAGLAACWLVETPRALPFQLISLGGVFVAALFPQSIEIATRTSYSTDSAAFDQIAARALQHGADPYVASMSGAARLLSVPAHYWTYTVDGGHVAQFSYPAGSFLLSLPATALGLRMPVDWTDLVAWLVTIGLLFAMLPASLRWLVGLLGLTPFFLGAFSSGGTDAMFLPFLVVAVWRWDRYGRADEVGLARWIGPIALGLACAIKQTPWFAIPMLAVGVYLETRGRGAGSVRVTARYLLVVAVTFAVVNLPFLAWHPGAWWHGTLIPLTGGLVADGQGLVTLATHGLTGGVNLDILSVTAALGLLVAVAAFAAWYAQLKRIWPLLLTLPFFLSPRSLSSYLLDLIPVVLVAAITVDAPPAPEPRTTSWRRLWARPSVVVVAAGCIGVVVTCILAFSEPPLQLSVRSVETSHAGTVLIEVTVTVANRTALALEPHFLVNTATSQNYEGFWTPLRRGALALGPHASETVRLYPPAQSDAPRRGSRWLVEAYTQNPSWLSTSSASPFPPA